MAVAAISDVSYGDAPHQLADVYVPAGQSALPVVLFFHGGAWQAGDRRFDVERCRRWAEWGFAVANIEYRLATPAAPSWPAVQDDLEKALQWAHGDGLSPFDLQVTSVGVAGISSGAHLAALLALSDDRVRAAVLIAGVYDLAQLRDYWRLTRVDDPTVALLGVDLPDDPRLYREASPQYRLHLLDSPPLASFLLLWTEDDLVAPARQQEAFAKSLDAVGADTEHYSWPTGGHFGWCRLPGFSHPGGGMQDAPNPDANARARAFLERTLGQQGRS